MLQSPSRLLVALAVLVWTTGAAAETTSAKAAMSWNGHGRVLQINTDEMELLGVAEGILYYESSEGELDQAFIECTFVQRLRIKSGEASARGNCLIVQSGEDNVFAEHRCDGRAGACEGRFTLTGGTGRFEGISGGSPLIIRSSLHQLIDPGADMEEVVIRNGVLLLPDLQFSLPGGR